MRPTYKTPTDNIIIHKFKKMAYIIIIYFDNSPCDNTGYAASA
jgi:hypothetical protein